MEKEVESPDARGSLSARELNLEAATPRAMEPPRPHPGLRFVETAVAPNILNGVVAPMMTHEPMAAHAGMATPLMTMSHQMSHQPTQRRSLDVFDMMDVNHDGVISRNEFYGQASPAPAVQSYMPVPQQEVYSMPPPMHMQQQAPPPYMQQPCMQQPSYPTYASAPPDYMVQQPMTQQPSMQFPMEPIVGGYGYGYPEG